MIDGDRGSGTTFHCVPVDLQGGELIAGNGSGAA
jgi:hypothetical protein